MAGGQAHSTSCDDMNEYTVRNTLKHMSEGREGSTAARKGNFSQHIAKKQQKVGGVL